MLPHCLMVSLLACLTSSCLAQDEASSSAIPFSPEGPITKFMVDGAQFGFATGGLPFTISISDGGKTIVGAPLELKGEDWKGPIRITLENPKFENGKLTLSLKLGNEAKASIQGLRIDLGTTAEAYTGSGDQEGKPLSRAQTAILETPVFAGDLAQGESTDSLTMEIGAVFWAPETTRLDVTLKVSGQRFLGPVRREDFTAGSMAIDQKGRLIMGDASDGAQIMRYDPANEHVELFSKIASSPIGLAANPKSGETYAYPGFGDGVILHLSASGDELDPINPDASPDQPPQRHLRIGPDGALWTCYDGIVRLLDGKAAGTWSELSGGARVSNAAGFDVASSGIVWLTQDSSLFRLDTASGKSRRVTSGPDAHLGRLLDPGAVRIDAAGQIYVAEGPVGDAPARVSVFDTNGKFVRTFGHAGRTAPAEFMMNEGQVETPHDIAFGRDGRVYVSVAARKMPEDAPAANVVMMFMPF